MPRIAALPTDLVRAWQSGAPDAYGKPPERQVAHGPGNPCRHCLGFIPEGAEMLVLAHRPFDGLHPYAETGPIFVCAAPCVRFEGAGIPPALRDSPDYLLKGYGADERIVYGTGKVVVATDLMAHAEWALQWPGVAYVDVRSARNNCFQARILPG
ncbi:MAG: DUF1203 domain-containing protein [Roseovarius sp.]|nr:DUF1203 domain-containing protein [Roseovarius sp.]